MSNVSASAVPASSPASGRAVVLVNVGTPEAPTPAAVRAYLREFLGDPNVVDLSPLGRWLLLNLIILPFRPARSAHAYRAIWTEQGSPLLTISRAQRAALEAALDGAAVHLAMRYGEPSLAKALEAVRASGARDVTLVPLFPQFAQATAGTVVDAWRALEGEGGPKARVLPAFYGDRGFVEAYAARLRESLASFAPDHVLFSYHGLPWRQVARVCSGDCRRPGAAAAECPPVGDANRGCYRAQCYATTRALASAAGLPSFSTSFQSRLKGTEWVGPFTDEVLEALAKGGVKKLAVACPAFVADCLETLEEIGMRGKETFLAAGGQDFLLVPSPNDDPRFIQALAGLVRAQWQSPTGAP